jgi:hypothetical protein
MNRSYDYIYEGPVMAFERCVDAHWRAETRAVSEAKARANLEYRYKKMTGRSQDSKITLPGKFRKIITDRRKDGYYR